MFNTVVIYNKAFSQITFKLEDYKNLIFFFFKAQTLKSLLH